MEECCASIPSPVLDRHASSYDQSATADDRSHGGIHSVERKAAFRQQEGFGCLGQEAKLALSV
jgi:hypothetical protein